MLRLYFDEDSLQKALVEALRRADFDCLTVNEAGMRSRPDAEQLSFASHQGRILYTRNTADYRRLDAEWRISRRTHSGIVVLTRQRTSVGDQLRAFEALASKLTQADMTNRMEFLLNHLRR